MRRWREIEIAGTRRTKKRTKSGNEGTRQALEKGIEGIRGWGGGHVPTGKLSVSPVQIP